MMRLSIVVLSFLSALSYGSHECAWDKFLRELESIRSNPFNRKRILLSGESASETFVGTLSDLRGDLRIEAELYLGKKVVAEAPADSTVFFGVELERAGQQTESFRTVTLYVADPRGGYIVHQGQMHPEDGVDRRTFHVDFPPEKRRSKPISDTPRQ